MCGPSIPFQLGVTVSGMDYEKLHQMCLGEATRRTCLHGGDCPDWVMRSNPDLLEKTCSGMDELFNRLHRVTGEFIGSHIAIEAQQHLFAQQVSEGMALVDQDVEAAWQA